jgi:hypothetical protein
MGKVLRFDQSRVRASVLARFGQPVDSLIGRPEPAVLLVDPQRRTSFSESVRQWQSVESGAAAAWLVQQCKVVLHQAGMLRVHLPAGEEPPTWYVAALSGFRRRPTRWRVREWRDSKGCARVEIRWLRWGKRRRAR